MDSALSDPHNGSAEATTPPSVTTRPPSTPEGIALAYGSLLLMALLPIFFGALRSVRCARGKVGSGRERAPSTPILATAPRTRPRRLDSCPFSRVTHPPGYGSPFPSRGFTSVAGLWCPRIWPLPDAGIRPQIVSGSQTDPAISPPPDPCFMPQLETLSARPQTQRQALTLSLLGPAPPDAIANKQPGVCTSPWAITPSHSLDQPQCSLQVWL